MLQRVGAFEVLREVGRGGMGVVYLATDTRLDRQVAIKALPVELASDPARLERFEREARTLAQLSHPNLAGIHGVEEQDGAKYLILEYVEGRTLAEMLDRGPLPVDEAIDLAVQIAAGIEAAHEAGVIHRDLKPANVIVTPDGQAKVLDFGLARTEDGEQSSAGGLDSPTMTTPQPQHSPTIAGAILGTAAYMSPEQARGRRVDRRTDVWSFGVVLYEMLVGASPFVGDTVSDSIGAVLHKGVDPGRLPPDTPANVRRVLERCLERDTSLRFRDIGDVRIELRRGEETPLPEPAPAGSLPRWLAPVAGLALVAVAAATWIAKPIPKPAPAPVVRSDIALPGDMQLAHAFMPGIALSADGLTLAFSAGRASSDAGIDTTGAYFSGALHVRRLGEPDAVPVAGAEDARQPAFSPDGSRIAYVRPESRFSGRIETIAVTGGRATPLTAGDIGVVGLDWSDDGRIVFGSRHGLRSIPDGGGPAAPLTTPADDGTEVLHAFPDVLPGGRGILYTVVFEGNDVSRITVRVLDPARGESRDLLTDASNARYTRGHLVFARDHTIHAVPFDLETLSVRGEPRPLGMSVIQSYEAPNSWFINGAAQFAVSDAGDLAYGHGTIWPKLPTPVAWVTRDGDAEVIPLEAGAYLAPRVDPAGRRLLLADFYGPTSGIWMHDVSRGVTSRVRRDGGNWVAWGPGPDDYTFHTNVGGSTRVGWTTIGDSAEPVMLDLPPGAVDLWTIGWSPGGRHLLGMAGEMGENTELIVWTEDEGWVELTDTPDLQEFWPSFSPDGRWIAYGTREAGGETRIHVRSLLGDGPVIQVSTTDSSAPLWSPDGTELYYLARDDDRTTDASGARSGSPARRRWAMAAPVTLGASSIEIGRPARLFRTDDHVHVQPIRSWDVGPDGRFLVALRPSEDAVRSAIDAVFPDRIRLVRNWARTLAERAR